MDLVWWSRHNIYNIEPSCCSPETNLLSYVIYPSSTKRVPGGGHGNPLQCSYRENPTDRGAWQATLHGSQTVGYYWARMHSKKRPVKFLFGIVYLRIGGGLVAKSSLILATPWTVACQAPLCMGFPRPEYWSGLPFPSPGALPHLGIACRSPMLQADSLLTEPPGNPTYWDSVSFFCKMGIII